MNRTYAPPAALFERTRCTIARFLIPVVWGLALLTLRILPPLHPYRIYTSDRIRDTRDLGVRACTINSPGRLLPAQLPHLLSAYLVVDALSYKIKGPFDLISAWHLDERVHLLHRIAEEIANVAPFVTELLG